MQVLWFTYFPVLSCLREGQLELDLILVGEPVSIFKDMISINLGSIGQPCDGNPQASF